MDRSKAPVPKSWLGGGASRSGVFVPHPTFGFACPLLKANANQP